jgi:hypothetical protein
MSETDARPGQPGNEAVGPSSTPSGAISLDVNVKSIDLALRKVPAQPEAIEPLLAQHPSLAKEADAFGYSLLHAAASYNHPDLVRLLVKKYGASVEMEDQDRETPLFFAETVDIARVLIEECGGKADHQNSDGETFAQKLEQTLEAGEDIEGWELKMLEYLKTVPVHVVGRDSNGGGSKATDPDAMDISIRVADPESDPTANELPVDDAFQERLRELAARPDFQAPEGQRLLRELVGEAVGGMRGEEASRYQGRAKQAP